MRRGKLCTICAHPKRHQIEIGLTYKVPHRVLAARFELSPDALWRHQTRHLSPAIRAAILTATKPSAVDLEALQTTESEGLLSQLVMQRARLQQHTEMALNLGNVRTCVAVESCIQGNLELVAKLLGQLVQRHEVRRTSILISADYLQLRNTIIRSLREFPEAARVVGQALHEMEASAAEGMLAAKPPVNGQRLLAGAEVVHP